MKHAVDKIKAALSTKGLVPELTHYLIQDGMMIASNDRVTAATPIALDAEILIPGAELEKILTRFEDPQIIIKEGEIQFKEKRFRAKLRLPPLSTYKFSKPEDDWNDIPGDLLTGLAMLRPFLTLDHTHAWATAACLATGALWATNSFVLCKVDCKGLQGGKKLLPAWAIDFLLQQDPAPIAMILKDHYAAFKWHDGSWMRSQLIVGEFPKNAATILKDASGIPKEISMEWREAYARVAGLSENEIRIYADKITGGGSHSEVEYEIPSPIPEGKKYSAWDSRQLSPVLDVATHIALESWPDPSAFYGDNIKGVIVGRG